jgi:hypothetical protein
MAEGIELEKRFLNARKIDNRWRCGATRSKRRIDGQGD